MSSSSPAHPAKKSSNKAPGTHSSAAVSSAGSAAFPSAPGGSLMRVPLPSVTGIALPNPHLERLGIPEGLPGIQLTASTAPTLQVGSTQGKLKTAHGKKTKGRVKIKMEFIDNKLRRYTTFSKRKAGLMKKAYELSTLTGTEVMLLVASETGHVYTFATRKLQPMITSEAGKALIQTCLNSPDLPSGSDGHADSPVEHRMNLNGTFDEDLGMGGADDFDDEYMDSGDSDDAASPQTARLNGEHVGGYGPPGNVDYGSLSGFEGYAHPEEAGYYANVPRDNAHR
ncbi:serum response factor homolog [Paramacrobiotus metropolitanus]|uniref:serum response factor homolog n=1 Tax=Paramacrobiotus metropolitanus TaxID=2943436 RepID=UPI0024459FB4|nr:serum response factor homolog [Paramacrobiotus metropolitanus]XP_055350590.1 serum response factor homolog [Paramacrobiotus metropolitanus]XP_055350591.1 serum response factor homolog [Paramacrobiotus metropolitanus]XP_055350592.1 serum response factor homolog [Paramacrobiotus metropolitanus]XP_055350593.1 serum response factor homolog [Paramacrobiotus metropolitanus]XP_055350595.1 serum response factor homolog [Paramacrobiotus metropolitanus]XP_055350596.1 serum response factor homolog [P